MTTRIQAPVSQATLLSELQCSQARAHLHKILGSRRFKASERIKRFLAFVVEETLAGRSHRIKGYNVAVEALGRDDSFDPDSDPIVRIEAGRLRRALEHYYLTDGASDSVRIEIPKGSYVPSFGFTDTESSDRAGEETGKGGRGYEELPTIAVLPFRSLGEHEVQTVFADGLTAELIVALTRYPDLSVVSNYSTQVFRSPTANTAEIGRALKVRFLLTGVVRKSNDRFRVSVSLHDTKSGTQIWAETMERLLTTKNLFDSQDLIAREVVVKLADIYEGMINRTLVKESQHERVENLTAYQAVLALHHYNVHYSEKAHVVTLKALEQAVAAEPDYAMGWAALAEINLDAYTLGLAPAGSKSAVCVKSLELARKALWLDRNCHYAHFVSGLTYLVARDGDNVRNSSEQLLAASESTSMRALGGWLRALAGDWQPGFEILQRHMREYVGHPGWLLHVFFLESYRKGDFESALVAATQFNMPYLMWDPLERAAVLGQLDRRSASQQALQDLLTLQPDFANHPKRYLECFILQDDLVDMVLDGLVKAGLRGDFR